ncbi:MAG: U32 family peptidase [Sphaerochaetaceae bacterium]
MEKSKTIHPIHTMELALPAGSLQSALQAFKEGADAVYLGLKQFSARKGAVNFSFEDLARLKQVAVATGKKIYVTVNTLVTDGELDELQGLLRRIAFLRLDGAIVQDLGVARIIHEQYRSSIPLHASTQLAVHTISGVKALQNLGFYRVVLSRELTLEEIASIRVSCPDIELKVFIHGALCYGFSGLCMASQQITGRSANRGECAQICRSWFTLTEGQQTITSDPILPESASQAGGEAQTGSQSTLSSLMASRLEDQTPDAPQDGYFFSMTDLDGGKAVRALQEMGIDSLKIEGRMKSPAYVAAATRYYRMILDGERDAHAIEAARIELTTLFARKQSGGWLADYGRVRNEQRQTPPLGNPTFPGHLGVAIGQIAAIHTTSGGLVISFRTTASLAIRDGLLLLQSTNRGLEEPIRFSLAHLWDVRHNRVFQVEAGEQVFIAVPPESQIHCGDTLYRISSHDQTLAETSAGSLPLYRYPIDTLVTILNDRLILCTTWQEEQLPHATITREYPLDIQEAKSPQKTQENLVSILSASGDSLCTLGKLTIKNESQFALEQIFLPLSRLKELRRAWYYDLDHQLAAWFEGSPEASLAPSAPTATVQVGEVLPPRSRLTPPHSRGLEWIDPERVLHRLQKGIAVDEVLAVVDGLVYLPLAPVLFSEQAYLEVLDHLVDTLETLVGRTVLRVGLNNIGQFLWAQKHPGIACFADIYLYVANAEAARLLLEQLPNLCGLYWWLEREKGPDQPWPCIASDPGVDFKPPLFISRSCFRHDSLGLSCENCTRNGTWHVQQMGDRNFVVNVHNCLTVVSSETR